MSTSPFSSVEVIRSTRRTRSVSAQLMGDRLVVRIPARFSPAQEKHWVDTLTARVLAKQKRSARTDQGLAERSAALAAQILEPRLGWLPEPRSVRWVTNQNSRWGSCSVETREIRLSHRLQAMPAWVVDQVLLHELAHLAEPSHNARFRALIDHQDSDRAEAYLQGWSDGSRFQVSNQPD